MVQEEVLLHETFGVSYVTNQSSQQQPTQAAPSGDSANSRSCATRLWPPGALARPARGGGVRAPAETPPRGDHARFRRSRARPPTTAASVWASDADASAPIW